MYRKQFHKLNSEQPIYLWESVEITEYEEIVDVSPI